MKLTIIGCWSGYPAAGAESSGYLLQQDGSVPGHMNNTDAENIAQTAAVKKLLLTHLPKYGDINELITDAGHHFSGDVKIARSGWTWE